MDNATAKLGKYISEKGFTISKICKETGIKGNVLYPSLKGKRELRADEFLAVCSFLEVNPMVFANTDTKKNEKAS